MAEHGQACQHAATRAQRGSTGKACCAVSHLAHVTEQLACSAVRTQPQGLQPMCAGAHLMSWCSQFWVALSERPVQMFTPTQPP